MKVAFFGSPAFALPSLEALHTHHELVLVVAQADKPAGRGRRLTPPAVAARARELGLPLEQPAKLKKNRVFFERLAHLAPDVAVTAAYGKLLPQGLLDIPKHGFLNVHASLLPRYRGAAPIQWALINGERETGVTIMQTEAGLDTGPIRLQRRLAIEAEDTAVTLFDKLSRLGCEALLEALEKLEAGTLPCIPQDEAQASYAPLLTKEDGLIRWRESAEAIHNRFRGVLAWPGTVTYYGGVPLKVPALAPRHGLESRGVPGEIVALSPEGLSVATGDGTILLKVVQPVSRAQMPARDWANGYGVRIGTRFESGPREEAS
jgi:methionyl-tRNA formyltransferase